MATDWISAYRKYVGTNIPVLTGGNPPAVAPPSGQIIGNNRSKVYHVPGCPGYNRVSAANQVTFMTAEDAEAAGYRKAKNCP
ncbi:MAG: hypothetical protein J2P21_23375 [Chloracidobacterium sp.]|nr:hypothetical protein [Chloracidobacterium sp.]